VAARNCALLLQPVLPPARALAIVGLASVLVSALSRRPAWLGLAAGFATAWLHCAERLEQRLDAALEGTTIVLKGRVASVPQTVGNGLRFRLAPEQGAGMPPLVELTWYEPEWRPRAAERLEVEVRLRRPRGFANPGGGDLEARMLREGIGATGYVRRAARLDGGARDPLRFPVLVLRDAIHDAIREALGQRPATGIVAGLAVGLQDALSPQQWHELSRSGTSHLMAISGMHVGMFALVGAWIAARVQRSRQRRGATGAARDAALLAGSVAALAYASLAGWSVPAQRTAIMIAIVAVALRSRRRRGAADALAGRCAGGHAARAAGAARAGVLAVRSGRGRNPARRERATRPAGRGSRLPPVTVGRFGRTRARAGRQLRHRIGGRRRRERGCDPALHARGRAGGACSRRRCCWPRLRRGLGHARGGVAHRGDLAADRGAGGVALGDVGRGRLGPLAWCALVAARALPSRRSRRRAAWPDWCSQPPPVRGDRRHRLGRGAPRAARRRPGTGRRGGGPAGTCSSTTRGRRFAAAATRARSSSSRTCVTAAGGASTRWWRATTTSITRAAPQRWRSGCPFVTASRAAPRSTCWGRWSAAGAADGGAGMASASSGCIPARSRAR